MDKVKKKNNEISKKELKAAQEVTEKISDQGKYWWKISVPPTERSISVLDDVGTLAATRTFLRYVARVSTDGGEENMEGWVCSEKKLAGGSTSKPQLDEVNKVGTKKS